MLTLFRAGLEAKIAQGASLILRGACGRSAEGRQAICIG